MPKILYEAKRTVTDLPIVQIRRLCAVGPVQPMCAREETSERNDIEVFAVAVERIMFNVQIQQRRATGTVSQTQ